MTNVRAPTVTEHVAHAAKRLMDPLVTDPPLDLHEAAEVLGIMPADLDRALWSLVGRAT